MQPNTLITITVNNLRNQSLPNTEHSGEFLAGMGVAHANDFDDLFVGQFVAPVHPTFFGRIKRVLVLRAKEEVRRVYAKGVVAAGAIVQHAQAIWNRSIVHDPAYPMSVSVVSGIAHGNLAILVTAFTVRCACPNPTGCGLNNFRPETFDYGWGAALLDEDSQVRVGLFSIHRMLGRALGCFRNARAFLFLSTTLPQVS